MLMRKGVNAWIYPSKFTIDEVLEASANIGFEGVELNINEKALNFSKKRRREIAKNASSLGLELPSLCTDLFWKFNLASPEEKVRKKGVEIIEKGCEFASDIGSKVLLVVPAVAVPEITYEETWRLARESILKAALTAEDHEVILGIENVWNRFLYSPLEFRRFIEEINHPYVKMYFDVGNVHFLGFPQQWIRYLSDLIVCIHVKGFLRSERQFKPLLEGDIPWPEVMKALRDIKYKGFLNVELPPYPGHPLKAAIDSKAALDIILKM
ncbi:sugar phosphate isomerase/epimerase [Candidatus Bathyarchaeota archaeon]|nr:MAG: sugar phosphate isomerase/epimerase [Candidatus Bathyarchaeota archaeon]